MHFIVANSPSEPKLCRRPPPQHPCVPEKTPPLACRPSPHKGGEVSWRALRLAPPPCGEGLGRGGREQEVGDDVGET